MNERTNDSFSVAHLQQRQRNFTIVQPGRTRWSRSLAERIDVDPVREMVLLSEHVSHPVFANVALVGLFSAAVSHRSDFSGEEKPTRKFSSSSSTSFASGPSVHRRADEISHRSARLNVYQTRQRPDGRLLLAEKDGIGSAVVENGFLQVRRHQRRHPSDRILRQFVFGDETSS